MLGKNVLDWNGTAALQRLLPHARLVLLRPDRLPREDEVKAALARVLKRERDKNFPRALCVSGKNGPEEVREERRG